LKKLNFVVTGTKRWGASGRGVRWGILCTSPHNGHKELLQVDDCHFYIAEYKEEARLYLIDPDNVDQNTRKTFKMKIVKLQESYTLVS
jgi:hypothetical protein